jgi:hypothetical protein
MDMLLIMLINQQLIQTLVVDNLYSQPEGAELYGKKT